MAWWKWVLGAAGIGIIVIKYRMGGAKFKVKVDMTGKTVIITGANVGIGRAVAYELAKRNARVILACRDIEKGKQTVAELRKSTKEGELVAMQLDLASFASIQRFAEAVRKEVDHLDVLINNAAVFQCPFEKTVDGLEMQMGVNHLGHHLLTNLLLDLLIKSAPSRVVVVSSGLAQLGKIEFENLNSEHHYDRKAGYYNSKLANNLFGRELSKKLEGENVGVHCLSPGMARTELGRHVPMPRIVKAVFYPLYWLLTKSPLEAAQTVLYCAMSPELNDASGKMYKECKEIPWTGPSLDDGVAKKLWEVSDIITKLA